MILKILFLVMPLSGSLLNSASDPEFEVEGERIERAGHSWGSVKPSGADFRIEKGSYSIAWLRKRGSKWAIETFSGRTLGWLNGDRIERTNGATWARMETARKLVEGPDNVAAALWVLRQLRKI